MVFPPIRVQIKERSDPSPTRRASVVIVQREAAALIALQLVGNASRVIRDIQGWKGRAGRRLYAEGFERRDELRRVALDSLIIELGLVNVWLCEELRLSAGKPHGEFVLAKPATRMKFGHGGMQRFGGGRW